MLSQMSSAACMSMNTKLLTTAPRIAPRMRGGMKDATARFSSPRMRYSSPAAWKGVTRMIPISNHHQPGRSDSSKLSQPSKETETAISADTATKLTTKHCRSQRQRIPPTTELIQPPFCPTNLESRKTRGTRSARDALLARKVMGVIVFSTSSKATSSKFLSETAVSTTIPRRRTTRLHTRNPMPPNRTATTGFHHATPGARQNAGYSRGSTGSGDNESGSQPCGCGAMNGDADPSGGAQAGGGPVGGAHPGGGPAGGTHPGGGPAAGAPDGGTQPGAGPVGGATSCDGLAVGGSVGGCQSGRGPAAEAEGGRNSGVSSCMAHQQCHELSTASSSWGLIHRTGAGPAAVTR